MLRVEAWIPQPPLGLDIAAALASYVQTIRFGDSRFDRYTAGRIDSFNVLEKAGLQLFRGKGGCINCEELVLNPGNFRLTLPPAGVLMWPPIGR